MAKRESKFQSELIEEIEDRLPGCIVMKRSAHEHHQPNQDYYISFLDGWSFASFVYPENKEEVLDAMEQALQPRRKTRVFKR